MTCLTVTVPNRTDDGSDVLDGCLLSKKKASIRLHPDLKCLTRKVRRGGGSLEVVGVMKDELGRDKALGN